jgi:hypothetical protein
MNRMKLFVAALILIATALIPKSAPALAGCTLQQCVKNANCGQFVCPPGYHAIPQCIVASCDGYCICSQFPSGSQ